MKDEGNREEEQIGEQEEESLWWTEPTKEPLFQDAIWTKIKNQLQHFFHIGRIDSPTTFKIYRIDSRFTFKSHKIDSPSTFKSHKIDSLISLKAT